MIAVVGWLHGRGSGDAGKRSRGSLAVHARVDQSGNIHQYASCKGNLNDGKFCNPEADRLLNEARGEPDEAKRKTLYKQFLDIMADERPIIYLYYLPYTFVAQKKIKGFVPYPDGLIRLRDVEFAQH